MQLFKYEAVIAKCRCLYGKLLKSEDYENLLKFTAISDIASYLRDRTAYIDFFGESSNFKTINRSKLEYYIKKSLINDFIKIYRFISGRERHFVNMLLAKHELEFLLKTWRHFVWLNTENNSINSNEYLLDIGVLEIQMIYMIYQYDSKINLEKLKTASTVEQFMDAIRETHFFYMFAKHTGEDITKNYTELETAIYNEYYKMLYSAAEVFDNDTKKTVQRLIGTDIDLINLDRMSRLLFNFSGEDYNILPFLVPIRFKLKDDDMRRLISFDKSGSKESFFEYCGENLYYGRKQSFGDYTTIEQYKWDFLYKLYRSSEARTRSGFDVIIRYFFLKEIEIKNLFCLIEGVRYQMNPDQIRRYMTGFNLYVKDERGTV